MFIVGEKINTSLKGLEEAVANKDEKFFQELAKKQVGYALDGKDSSGGSGCSFIYR